MEVSGMWYYPPICVYAIRQNMSSKVTVETLPIMPGGSGSNDIWKDFSFVYDHSVARFPQTDIFCYSRIVRTLPTYGPAEPTFKLVVKSEYILKACKDVIQSWPGVFWNNDPLEVSTTYQYQ
jgi:hypothetical protein